jgi:hypothetical protein
MENLVNAIINQSWRVVNALLNKYEAKEKALWRMISPKSTWNFDMNIDPEFAEPVAFDWGYANSVDLLERLDRNELITIYKELCTIKRSSGEEKLMLWIKKRILETQLKVRKSYAGDVVFLAKAKRIGSKTNIKMMRDLIGIASFVIKFNKVRKPIKKEVPKRTYKKQETIKGIKVTQIVVKYCLYKCETCGKFYAEEDKDRICCKRSLKLHQVRKFVINECPRCNKRYQFGSNFNGYCYCNIPIVEEEINGPNLLTVMPREKGQFIEVY